MHPKHEVTGRSSFTRRVPALLASVIAIYLVALAPSARAKTAPLELSVYCTAGDVDHYLDTPAHRERALRALQSLNVTRLFLEGRRGDDYVPPARLREVRDFFNQHAIHCSGGVATVPGKEFAQRQQSGLDWLDWESPKTQAGLKTVFSETAPLFPETVVDDFFCTGDLSSTAAQAKGARSWGEYRRDLLVSLIEPLMLQPTRRSSPSHRLILKFPQWYDRFQLFGYDPARMPAFFDQVWVGTEVRNPETRRMGFVQPTEGYMNFRWLSSQIGRKVRGAWFDYIECTGQNFIDQAYLSVLAGAKEITLFNLADVVESHPGSALLAASWSNLTGLSQRLDSAKRRGLPFYKPAGSDGSENLYLADYLGMMGLPILPVAEYPKDSAVVFLPVQAAADPQLQSKMQRHLSHGATLVLTPALVRNLGPAAVQLAGVEAGSNSAAASVRSIGIGAETVELTAPLQLDSALQSTASHVILKARLDDRWIPVLTSKPVGRGRVLVLNIRTFSDADFERGQEYLLSPEPLGWPKLPATVADVIREELLRPLHLAFRAPAGVALMLYGKEPCFYNFRPETLQLQFQGKTITLGANQCWWNRGW